MRLKESAPPLLHLMASAKRAEAGRAKRSNDKRSSPDASFLSNIGRTSIIMLSIASKKVLGAVLGWAVFKFAKYS